MCVALRAWTFFFAAVYVSCDCKVVGCFAVLEEVHGVHKLDSCLEVRLFSASEHLASEPVFHYAYQLFHPAG